MTPRPTTPPGLRRFVAEFVGTALLLAAIVGSGIMGERLSAGNVALALLANSLATGAALLALILTFAPISGAHFNPLITLAEAFAGERGAADTMGYILSQCLGALVGVAAANMMFGLPPYAWSQHERSGLPQLFSEAVATFGLVAVIWSGSRRRPALVPFAVAAYITAAYWFTSSTSFANPAVAIARSVTNTFAGIRPLDVPGFILAQGLGAGAAVLLFQWLLPGMDMIIFACVHNAGRSQMAAAFLNALADPTRVRATSAGTRPAEHVHPVVVEVMQEAGIDLTASRPQRLTEGLARRASLLVTMGCSDECPYVPGLARDDWPLDDPKDRPLADVRRIRDEIRARVAQLVSERGWTRMPE